ncbi:MAG: magnesium/cobalt transporter CorA [Candidatus Aminicenantes bacterium]|nr:magnesium/cobalt transporter CorA [Candidatus Aminicenantes bacterium]
MFKFNRKRIDKVGLPPGTPVYVGERKEEKVKISIIDFDETQCQEKEAKTVEECFTFKDSPTVTWINIDGIHEVDIIEKIGKNFDLHPLIIEDIVNTEQRPKIEDFGHYVYVVLRMLYFDEEAHEVKGEQISLILGKNFVISFQEREGDIFEPIRERIRNKKGLIRKTGADYLAYALLDTIVDNYFLILEKFGEKIQEMEERLISDPRPETLQAIHKMKREMIFLRKSVWPLREVINGIERGESSLFQKATYVFLRDVYDHTIQVIDTVETFRDMLSGMHDTYLSSISNRMNEIMKVLTIIATIFIPLTFIAGIYGMNFKFMPELEWRWAYFIVWLVIVIVAIFMIFFFRKKKWL